MEAPWASIAKQATGSCTQTREVQRVVLESSGIALAPPPMAPLVQVPLSEGRIDESGLLQCSYHGWTFAGDGSCQGIPQAAATGPEQKAISSPRACAVSFPTTEQRGILFVWPDPDPSAAARAEATAPPLPVGVDDSFFLSSFSREVLYGYDMLAENVMDPSHLPFAHHGVGPLRRSAAKPYPVASVVSEVSAEPCSKASQSRRCFQPRLAPGPAMPTACRVAPLALTPASLQWQSL